MTGTTTRKPAKDLRAHDAAPKGARGKTPATGATPRLLSGGNPQIPKGYGDAPVQAYIAAMPGWKRDLGRRLDALIVARRPRREEGGQMEHALLRRRGRRLVPQLPLLHEVREGDLLPRHVAQSRPRPARPSTRKCATSTSTRTSSTRRSSSPGWSKPAGCPANGCERTGRKAMATENQSEEGNVGASPSQLIDARIAELADWRGETLARVRSLIRQADPEVVEEWKWRGVPVWSHAGIICTGETYKAVVKLTFARGARWTTPPASSTPASRATPAAPSTSARATRSTKRR